MMKTVMRSTVPTTATSTIVACIIILLLNATSAIATTEFSYYSDYSTFETAATALLGTNLFVESFEGQSLGAYDFPVRFDDLTIDSGRTPDADHKFFSKSNFGGTKAMQIPSTGLGCYPYWDIEFKNSFADGVSVFGMYFYNMNGINLPVTITDSDNFETDANIDITSSEYFWGIIVTSSSTTFIKKMEFSPDIFSGAYNAKMDEMIYGVIDTAPLSSPTTGPTSIPSAFPSLSPTSVPTKAPTDGPSTFPTLSPVTTVDGNLEYSNESHTLTLSIDVNGESHEMTTILSDLASSPDTTVTGSGDVTGTDLNLNLDINGVSEQITVDLSSLVDSITTASSKTIVSIQATGNHIGGEKRKRRKLSNQRNNSAVRSRPRRFDSADIDHHRRSHHQRTLKGDSESEVYFGYEEEIVDGFVVINDGSIVGLSGLLAYAIENPTATEYLEIEIEVTSGFGGSTTRYDGIRFTSGMRGHSATFASNDIPVKAGDIVTFIISQEGDIEPEKNSVSLVLLLEQ